MNSGKMLSYFTFVNGNCVVCFVVCFFVLAIHGSTIFFVCDLWNVIPPIHMYNKYTFCLKTNAYYKYKCSSEYYCLLWRAKDDTLPIHKCCWREKNHVNHFDTMFYYVIFQLNCEKRDGAREKNWDWTYSFRCSMNRISFDYKIQSAWRD